jgi:lipoprotein-anchoring transpeptidase ErfK/SrfK
MCKRFLFAALITAAMIPSGWAAEISRDAIEKASFATRKFPRENQLDPLAVKVQALLARAHFSPGEIDGRFGENVKKALHAFAEANNLLSTKVLTAEAWEKLQQISSEPIIAEHVIDEDDLKGPFIGPLPSKMEDMKSLPVLGYASSREALAERFHMSEDLLASLNPGKTFDRPGEAIAVIAVSTYPKLPPVTRVEVDKPRETVKAFGPDDKVVAFFPASVGSEEKPTPSGKLKVTAVQRNPTYSYNPEYKFKDVNTREPFTIRPGPNNPVGSTWIALSEKGYGIHGTSEPSRVSKSESHGCVRLTNWDAERLAASVRKGTVVEFKEGPTDGTPNEKR